MEEPRQSRDRAPAHRVEGGRVGVSEFAMRQTLEAIAASEGTAILGTDVEGVITSWSGGAEALYGWTAEEVIGSPVVGLAPPELRGTLEAARETLRGGEPVHGWETERLRKDGTVALVRIDLTPIRDESGAVIGVASVHRDVSEQRRVEDALRAAEERYRTLVETLPLATYLVSLEEESRTLYMSPRGAELYGIPVEDLAPARVRELLHPDDRDRVIAEIARANVTHTPLTLEYRIIRPDGSVVWLEDRSVVVANGDGPPRSQGYVLDVSERKRLEEQLLQSQKMDAVGQLAGGIAHDFNNILTAIEGYTEFALDRVDGDEKLRDDLIEIRKAAGRAATLTSQILAFARRQVVRSRALDLNDVIDETKKLILRLIGEHIAVASRLEVPLGSVMADPSQLTQVLVNLAVNARDAMPGGGRLTIETANVVVGAVEALEMGLESGAYVALAVADTGIGMDAATAKRVFEPFFTTKPVGEGSGLGLSTVYGIARQSGGGVAIASEPGRGTTVRVYLPRFDDAADEPVDDVEAGGDAARGRGTILLVEDEDVIRRLAGEMLERQGYTVLSAADPQSAIELATREPAVDLLLTDVVMPVMNGPELARRLLNVRPSLRVLFTSGYPADAIAGGGLVDREASLLCKPFSSSELVAAVRDALQLPASPAAR